LAKHSERKIIDAIMTLDDTWRTFDHNLTSWGRLSDEEKAKLKFKIDWASYVSDILAKMATIDELSQSALMQLERSASKQKA